MRERGVIFKAHEVRAILAGTKTQLRAVVKPESILKAAVAAEAGKLHTLTYPYGQPGDRLWVRETACYQLCDRKKEKVSAFKADGIELPDSHVWSPSTHMPRWASRLTLEVESVRVERLQEISAEDIIAEGVRASVGAGMINGDTCYHMTTNSGYMRGDSGARHAFWDFWNSIHGAGAWETNPFIWVVAFKRILP